MTKRVNRVFFWLTAVFYFWSFYVQNPISVSYSMEFGLSGAAKPAHAGAKPQIRGKLPKNVVPVLLLCLFCGITVNAVQSFTEPFAKRSGQTAGLELFFAVYAGALVLVRFALAGGLTRMKLRSAVLLLSPVTVLAMLLMQYQQSAAALLAAAVAAAMGIGCMQTMSQCLVFERFGPDGKNQASSLFYMFFYGGMIAGSFGGSAIFTSSAGGSLFLLYAALSVLPFAAALLRPGRG